MTNHIIYKSDAEVRPVAPNLWAVSNCFDQSTFDWLSQLHLAYDESWHRHQDCLEYRIQLTPESKSYKPLLQIHKEMTESMEQIVNQPLEPVMTKVWLDLPNFHCPVHCDADLLLVTYQVYLWEHGANVPGTTFSHVTPNVTIPFAPNTGYINLNTDQKIHFAMPHSDGGRLSVCFQWRPKM